jgi:seryl-tRNA synthetase
VNFTISFPKPIDDDRAAEVEKQGVYASPHVRRLRVNAARTAVEVESEDGVDAAEVEAKVARFVEQMVTKFRKIPKKELKRIERRDRGAYETNVYAELKRRGWVIELGRGQVGLAGPALLLAQAIDRACAKLGRDHFGASDAQYPALIPAEILARCGYFTSFPQAVSMVSHIIEDHDLIEEFRQANTGGGLTIPRREAFPTPEACLSPAVCYHLYQSLEGATLDENGRCVTTVGKCFRYESKNIVGLDRLWDFTMREVIFVGTDSWVSGRRQRGIELVSDMIGEWDLDCVIEAANDPFFATVHTTKTWWQARGDLKFEMKIGVEPGAEGEARSIAAGSFNLHENFFGKTFTITASDSQPAFTGCLAWGIERWVLAGFTQHGWEPSRWPSSLRADVWG